jgi:diguanylate cyclase (GGDEF)-like protein
MNARILIADYQPQTRSALQQILSQHYTVVAGEAAGDWLSQLGNFRPDLIILDVDQPGLDWVELCRLIKARGDVPAIHVILKSMQWTTETRLHGYDAGADDQIQWPIDATELLARVRVQLRLRNVLGQSYALNARIETYNKELERLVEAKAAALEATQDVTVFALAKLADSRDTDTGEHLDRIRYYTQILAKQLYLDSPYADEIDETFLEELYRASPLHDIGKVGIPDSILLKPGRFTPEEFERMKLHTIVGAETLEQAASQVGSGHFLKMAAEIARFHHERFDGTGYPSGLQGSQIPLSARIVALADVYDALTSDRVYKTASTAEEARAEIVAQRGRHFDPVIVDAFLSSFEQFKRVRTMLEGKRPWGGQEVIVSNQVSNSLEVASLRSTLRETVRKAVLAMSDEVLRRSIAAALEAAGFQVRQATTGREAIALIERECPYFLIADWNLAEISGLELCRHLRRQRQQHYVYTIMLTEDADEAALQAALDAGADRVDVKPITAVEMVAGIRAGAQVIGLVRELSHQPRKDPLTGLATRQLIDDNLAREWRRSGRYRIPLSCVVLDIDAFRSINEQYGDSAGDGTLEAIAAILNDNCRATDLLFRHGGDQFCVVMPDTNEHGAFEWSERVQKLFVGMTLQANGVPYQVSVSCGVSQRRPTHSQFEDLLRTAEQSLLVAKKAGRNRVVRFGALGDTENLHAAARTATRSPFENTRARQIMASPILTLNQNQTVRQSAQFLLDNRINSVPVVDNDGRLVGIVSEKDLMTMMTSRDAWEQPVKFAMTPNVVAYDENYSVESIYKFLMRSPIRRVVIVRADQPVGVISRGTLLAHFRDQANELLSCPTEDGAESLDQLTESLATLRTCISDALTPAPPVVPAL